ncbi:hypothetical protein Gohar_021589 [Gossypium harknessii]|uniref:Fiber protein Fb14 n=1 Tax=Gossypium harknessii TaxID=34285 RepID=A0A7J9IB15_9ROSI|nr:hypothetical protein [Gossypium harknessii]
MASGWGINGTKGRCYDFWVDFSECMSRCREPKDCSLLREDYLECLHHSKESGAFKGKALLTITLPRGEGLYRFNQLAGSKNPVRCELRSMFQRRNRIYKEEQRKIRAAARKEKDGGDGVRHHA